MSSVVDAARGTASIGGMDAAATAARFAAAFHEVFLGCHRRDDGRWRTVSAEGYAVLQHLARIGPATVGEAARHFARSQSATSEILFRLERRGLVRRFRDDRDRRRNLVWLTPAGLELWRDSMRVLDEARLAAIFGTLSARQRVQTVRALERVVAAAGKQRAVQ
ncbi:MAG: winged helix-turn-helix transcriptional regulator [Planctomycetes bacterium]|nr:winged helix-turn-helix transcriptional regulator [Planctomycetota bacterium]